MNKEYIYTYTRQDAINDGIFVDVSEVAKELGFNIPVAITSNLFNTYIKKETETETNRRLKIFLRITWENISLHPQRDTLTLLTTKAYFDDKTPTDVWIALEAQSPTDPSPAINILLPEDY